MRARELYKMLHSASNAAGREVSGHAARGGLYARGMSGEGYAGGYRDALYDVMAVMNGGHPSDKWGFWTEVLNKQK